MNYGTGYGQTPKAYKLGREALALAKCDLLDKGLSYEVVDNLDPATVEELLNLLNRAGS